MLKEDVLTVAGGNGIATSTSGSTVSIVADLYLASGVTLSENQNFITNSSGEVEAVATPAVGFEISGSTGTGYTTLVITVGMVVVIQQSMSIVDSLIDLTTPLDLVTHLL